MVFKQKLGAMKPCSDIDELPFVRFLKQLEKLLQLSVTER